MSQRDLNLDACAAFLERIVYLLDDELGEDDVRDVQEHLQACAPCLETYDLQRTVKMIVARSCSEKAPNSLHERVRVQIQQIQVRSTE